MLKDLLHRGGVHQDIVEVDMNKLGAVKDVFYHALNHGRSIDKSEWHEFEAIRSVALNECLHFLMIFCLRNICAPAEEVETFEYLASI